MNGSGTHEGPIDAQAGGMDVLAVDINCNGYDDIFVNHTGGKMGLCTETRVARAMFGAQTQIQLRVTAGAN